MSGVIKNVADIVTADVSIKRPVMSMWQICSEQ